MRSKYHRVSQFEERNSHPQIDGYYVSTDAGIMEEVWWCTSGARPWYDTAVADESVQVLVSICGQSGSSAFSATGT